jgi:hypothetical protein
MSGNPLRSRLFLLGAAVTLGVTVAFLFEALYRRSPGSAALGSGDEPPALAPPPAWTPKPPAHKDTPSWESTPSNTGKPDRGFVPAWKVNPPRPDPSAPTPPTPFAPPDPQQNRPAMQNPGGINGVRPERKVPGIP